MSVYLLGTRADFKGRSWNPVALDDLSWTLYPLVPIWSLAASCVEFSSKHHGSMVWRCKSCIPGRVPKVCHAIVNAALSGVLATRLED